MTWLRSYTRGTNLGLSVAVTGVVAAVGLVAFGPWGARLTAVHVEVRNRIGALEEWRDKRERLADLTERTGSERVPQWEDFLARVPEVRDEPELLVSVAGAFDGYGVRSLAIERVRLADDDALGETLMEIGAPDASMRVALVAIPVRVAFHADFAPTVEILRQLEGGALAARVETLELTRRYPGVGVRLDLTYFVRREVAL